ncbi:threonine--tRNA ligase [Patescibacteria group bacterium]|nr:threonine--tRNA ligase [Patescibacteria group bacterium]
MKKKSNQDSNSDSLEIKRHSCSHLLAAAILSLYPNTKFGIGPAINNGFYYDLELKQDLGTKDLKTIEKKMHELIAKDLKFEKKVISLSEAEKLFTRLQQPYKIELLRDLKEKGSTKMEKEKVNQKSAEKVTIYQLGNFVDLCRGPHVSSTKKLNSLAFKLTKVAGAYWRGDEKNKMLTRIYGLAFGQKKDLKEYLNQQAEAEKRDHRKLGKELDLFCFSELVGPGLPLFSPKGVIIIEQLKKEIEKVCAGYGFEKVMTPHLAKIELYQLSGHASKFKKELFRVHSDQGHNFVMKPVQCPHQTQIYASQKRSYRDLPIRYMESEKQYRAEKTGEVGGLNRVYAITVEDGHSFCRVSQVKEEIKNMVKIIKDFYTSVGLWENHWVSLSLRDYEHQEKYIGEPKDWDQCEEMLAEISKEMNLNAKRIEGEAALYGPKLDFMFKDSLGNEIQIPTVQLDFATPKRFNLVYTNEKGEDEYVVMVHRAILGSYERFLALLIEHFAGAFPIWLSPIQVYLTPVGEKHIPLAQKLEKEIKEAGIRTELDLNSETVSYRVRKAEKQKIPYILVLGDKEKQGNLNIRKRGGQTEQIQKQDFIKKILEEISQKK